MKIYEILSKVLSKNEWGVFFKGEPLQNLPMQEGTTMYKVNEVSTDRLYDAIQKSVDDMENDWEQEKEVKPTDDKS